MYANLSIYALLSELWFSEVESRLRTTEHMWSWS